ncbi:hypothetical protein B0H17DRAFT_378779 [Mycena rosella]|uniref:Uncharacterized protein n=1 Tax=Mycena rosella TaxID=1033263 RepID=A0AAD7CNV5_MYCRO|nr:hypothetical protein B0H17DRAFT_378779 [Mycena rosella]
MSQHRRRERMSRTIFDDLAHSIARATKTSPITRGSPRNPRFAASVVTSAAAKWEKYAIIDMTTIAVIVIASGWWNTAVPLLKVSICWAYTSRYNISCPKPGHAMYSGRRGL